MGSEPKIAAASWGVVVWWSLLAQWLLLILISVWVWKIEISHPPPDLLERIGRQDGRLDEMRATVDSILKQRERKE